ncbi:MAG: phosphonate utilization associated transcriptional regulator [Betaproteobacteria bacterium]|nr:phosphonate utilization associated transcriptional regulator [Betaproteobacteria bacterium]
MLKTPTPNRARARHRPPPQTAPAAGAAPAIRGTVLQRNEPAPGTIAVLQANSLPMLVQREIERMILAGELPAGSKLNEAPLARSLGVSRGPVREAFRALEESGLVRLTKNRGVFVRQLAVEEADAIYELRAVLDEFVGRRLAKRLDPDALRELRGRVERMEKAAARNDVDDYHAANLDFHDRLVELAGNAKLPEVYRRLVNELRLCRHATLAQGGVLPVSTREHRDIVDRIAAGKPAAAGRALFDHVMGSRERMHRSLALPAAPPERPARKKP